MITRTSFMRDFQPHSMWFLQSNLEANLWKQASELIQPDVESDCVVTMRHETVDKGGTVDGLRTFCSRPQHRLRAVSRESVLNCAAGASFPVAAPA